MEERNLVAPENENVVRQRVRDFILASINLPDLEDDDNLFETGIVNSLFAVQLMTFLEKTFDIEVTMADLDLENFKSIAASALFVMEKHRDRSE